MIKNAIAEAIVKISEIAAVHVSNKASAWFHFQEEEPEELRIYSEKRIESEKKQ